MELETLEYPTTFSKMLHKYEYYYSVFYHEMVRMSNLSLSNYIEQYFEIITKLAKSSTQEDTFRAGVGITSLFVFGYNNFSRLSYLFDRIIPQKDPELVKFTSWCAGKLTHHPNIEQSNYVSHLLTRISGWIHSHGRRERHLAAAWLLKCLIMNAGSSIVIHLEQIQEASNALLTYPSFRVLEASIDAFSCFTQVLMKYRRSELTNYINFIKTTCSVLIQTGNPDKENTGFNLLAAIIVQCPDYFSSSFDDICDSLAIYETSPILVKEGAIMLQVAMAKVDRSQFISYFTDIYDNIDEILLEFPTKIAACINNLVDFCPEIVNENIERIKDFIRTLYENECFNELFDILAKHITLNEDAFLPLDEELLTKLIEAPLTDNFNNFFTAFSNTKKGIPKFATTLLCKKLSKELDATKPLIALKVIASLPHELFDKDEELLQKVKNHLMNESLTIKRNLPRALFNLMKNLPSDELTKCVIETLQIAVAEADLTVRFAVLDAIGKTCPNELSSPEAIDMLQVFMNDDAATVRKISFELLEKIQSLNPLYVTGMARRCLIDFFYIMKNLSAIRQKARVARIMPSLIKASSQIAKLYTRSFLDIFVQELDPLSCKKYANFMEETASIQVKKGVLDSLTLFAPLDSETISSNIDVIIPILCSYLIPTENRQIILSVLNCLFVLLSPMTSTIAIRSQCIMIFTACSNLLYETSSRKTRIALLKVIGAIGVIDMNEKASPNVISLPQNLDENLARHFYQVTREVDNTVNDTLLMEESKHEQYFNSVVTRYIFEIFDDPDQSDLYITACQAMVQVLRTKNVTMLAAFDQFVIILLNFIKTEDNEKLEVYLKILEELIISSKNNIVPYITQILDFVVKRFCPELDLPLIKIVLALVEATKDAFSPVCHLTLCLLLETLENSKTSNTELCSVILKIFEVMGPFSEDQLYLLVGQICDAIICDHTKKEVRLNAINTLKNLVVSTNMMPYIGIVIRSISFTIFNTNEEESIQASIRLLMEMTKYYEKKFIFKASQVIARMRKENKLTKELEETIKRVEGGEKFVKPDKLRPDMGKRILDLTDYQQIEDIIIEKASSPNFGDELHLKQWLVSLIRLIIQTNPRASIKACSSLANCDEDFTMKLFKPAFFCIWQKFSEGGRKTFTKIIQEILTAGESYGKVGREIISLLVFMHKTKNPINIPTMYIVKTCINYGCYPFALKLLEELYEFNSAQSTVIKSLIDIYIELGMRPNAIAVYNSCTNCMNQYDSLVTMEKLQFFDKCIDQYEKNVKTRRNFGKAFPRLISSYAQIGQWNKILDHHNEYMKLDRTMKTNLASDFAEAALLLGKWETLEKSLEFISHNSSRGNIIEALCALHNGDWKKVDECITHGFSLLASKPITFWSEHQTLHQETIIAAQKLVEIGEMKQWMQSQNKGVYEKVWSQRLRTAPKNFSMRFDLITNRICAAKIRDENVIRMFMLKPPNIGSEASNIFMHTYDVLSSHYEGSEQPDIDKVCFILAKRNAGEKEESLKLLKNILPQVQGMLKVHCNILYSSWIIEDNDKLEANITAYKCLEESAKLCCKTEKAPLSSPLISRRRTQRHNVTSGEYQFSQPAYRELTTDITRAEVLRKWAYISAELITLDSDNVGKYVTTVIECLTECINYGASFPDVVQLLSIFFERANINEVFEKTKKSIQKLPVRFLIQTTQQLLIQLSHKSENVANLVHDIILNLLLEHYHSIIFEVILTKESVNERRMQKAASILQEFSAKKPEESSEISVIQDALIRVTLTWYDIAAQMLEKIADEIDRNNWTLVVEKMQELKETLSNPACELERTFAKEFSSYIEQITSLTRFFNESNQHMKLSIRQWNYRFGTKLADSMKQIEFIQLPTISQSICAKTHFKFAVPGTYMPDKPINRIQYFFEQLYIFNSKQQPKSMIIKGENGNIYQYLLKGHEDLRLDERIMQFFKLVNSIMKKQNIPETSLIQTMCVMPIAKNIGLIQWVPGTDTLKSLIEAYRTMQKLPVSEEFELISEYGHDNYDALLPIQKLQVIKKVFEKVPDTDVANYFWIKAKDAENWLKITTTFSASTAINSAVGYIIGLGDRHPSNLLIDRNTGKVVHIDFGDCFEKTMKRKLLPEVMPFRLTRMIVRALGVTGVDGMFKYTFSNILSILRENWRTLILVLAIFVHEPIDETPDSQSTSPRCEKTHAQAMPRSESMTDGIRIHVKDKLVGNDFGKKSMTVEEQTKYLIEQATDTYNFSKMYHGWCPFW